MISVLILSFLAGALVVGGVAHMLAGIQGMKTSTLGIKTPAVVAVFLGVGMVFWAGLSIQVIRPMEKLAVYSQSISSNEKLSDSQNDEVTTLAKRRDQVGHLTDTLVHMEADIEARLTADDLASETVIVLRVGKKRYALLRFAD